MRRVTMSIAKFNEQMWPGMLSEAEKDYVPEPSHLFPIVVVKKVTQREIDKAFNGIHPVPSGKEAITITNNNIRRLLNESNENLNGDADASASVMTTVQNTDDIPDDPFIPMISDNDNIDSDDSDLPDLSNLALKNQKKSEKKDKISNKKGFNDQDKGEKKHITSDKQNGKMKQDKNEKSKKKSNEMVNSKHSEKYSDRNKIIDKDKMKNRKGSNDKEKYKMQSKILENNQSDSHSKLKDKDDLRNADKSSSEKINDIKSSSTSKDLSLSSPKASSSSLTSAKSTTEKKSSKVKSNPAPSAKPKVNLLSSSADSTTKRRDKEKETLHDLRKANISSSEKINDIKSRSTSKDLSSSSSNSSSSLISTKSTTENSISKENTNPAPSEEHKVNLLSFVAKTREVMKQKSLEQKARNSIQCNTPVVIKTEPVDITDPDDGMASQVPPSESQQTSSTSKPRKLTPLSDVKTNPQTVRISALLDDGDFPSQIDSDQETVDFGETQEKIDDENNGMENPNSSNKELEKSVDKIEKRRVNDNSDDQDRNKRKRDNFGETQEKNDDINVMENTNSSNKEHEKSLDKLEKRRLKDNNDDQDRNKGKRDCFGETQEKNDDKINGMENTNSSKRKLEKSLDKIEKRSISDNNDGQDRNKRKRDCSESSQEKKKCKGDDSNKNMHEESDKNKKDREGSKSNKSSQVVTRPILNQKLINDIASKGKPEGNKAIENIETSKPVTELSTKSVPLSAAVPPQESEKLINDIASKEKTGGSKSIENIESSKLVTDLVSVSLPPFAAVPTQEADKPACAPIPIVTNSTLVISEATPVQSASATRPMITPVDVSEAVKSSSLSLSVPQSKGERIKILKRIAELCKNIMKTHSSEEELRNECEEIKKKIIPVESKINEIQKEEERRVAELDFLHRQLDDIVDDEEKFAEYAQRMIDLTDCTEIRERKSNLEKDKRKLASELTKVENSLQEMQTKRKRKESEMASLKASLSNSSRSKESSSSPGPEVINTSNSQQACILSTSSSGSATSPASSKIRSASTSESSSPVPSVITTTSMRVQQQQSSTKTVAATWSDGKLGPIVGQQPIAQKPLLSQQHGQHLHSRQEQPQGVVATLREQILYETGDEPQQNPCNLPEYRQTSDNEAIVMIPKGNVALMQNDGMQNTIMHQGMMQNPVTRQMIQHQETIIKTYQTNVGPMGTIQQQQMMSMQQKQGLVQQQQDITQQSVIQASPRNMVPQQTTVMAPHQQMAQDAPGQQGVIMTPQQIPEGIVQQVVMAPQQMQQSIAITQPGTVSCQPQVFQAEPISGIIQQQQLVGSTNTQQMVLKQPGGQGMISYHPKESSPQYMTTPGHPRMSNPQHIMITEHPGISSPQHVMPDQARMSSPQHMLMSGQVRMSSPQHVMVSGQARMSSPQHVMVSGQARMSSPQHVMSVQAKMSSPQLVNSLGPPPSYSEALTQVTSTSTSSSSLAGQHQNQRPNSISTPSLLSQILQRPQISQASIRSRSQESSSQDQLQVQALQGQQALMNGQHQRLMSQGTSDSTLESGRKCPTPGCDGTGNNNSRRFHHISASACPKNVNKNFATPQNGSPSVNTMSAVTRPSSSSSFVVVMEPNLSLEDANMDDADASQPMCFLCGKQGEFTCCGGTIYCGVSCQEADFDRHQVECKNVADED